MLWIVHSTLTGSKPQSRQEELQTQQIEKMSYDLKELTSCCQQLEKRNSNLENSLSQLHKNTCSELREIKNASKLQKNSNARVEASVNKLEQTTGTVMTNIRSTCRQLEDRSTRVEASLNQLEQTTGTAVTDIRSTCRQLEDKSIRVETSLNQLEQTTGTAVTNIRSTCRQLKDKSTRVEASLNQLEQTAGTAMTDIRSTCRQLEDKSTRVEASLNQLEQTTGSTLNEIRNDCKESNARVKASLKQKNEALQQSLSEAREEVHRIAVSLELSKKDNHNIHTNLSEKLEKLIESKNEVERQWSERFSQAERRWTEQFTMAERSWKEQLEHLEPSWKIESSQLTVTDEKLGMGAYGEVRVGMYCGGQVAVKQLHEVIISPYVSKQFNREMQLTSRLRHPQLIQFIGAVTTDKVTLLVTELMETSLRKQLMQGRISKEHILPISRDVACALNYLHSLPEPIIHRDVSSANVLLNSKPGGGWMAKLGDFGSANFLAKLSTKYPGAAVYSAPESDNPKSQGPSMDVYSFGVLLFEVCTGEFPDPGQREALRSRVPFGTNQVITVIAKECTCSEAEYRPTMAAVLKRL